MQHLASLLLDSAAGRTWPVAPYAPFQRNLVDVQMQATVLVILYQGKETLGVYDDDAAAWDALLAFVDQNWGSRFDSTPPPESGDVRVEMFFNGEDMYLLASSDVTDL